MRLDNGGGLSPPLVDVHVGRAGEPGVQDEDTAIRGAAPEPLSQARVVVQAQALAEPVHNVLIPRSRLLAEGAHVTVARPLLLLSLCGLWVGEQECQGPARLSPCS